LTGIPVTSERLPVTARGLAWLGVAGCPPHLELPLRLTAIALLLRPMGPWYVRPLVLALAAAVLISPRVLKTPATWAALSALTALRILEDWPLADNHIYLLAYWLLAIALALRAPDVSTTLATASRWLVGLAFAFAVVWKLITPDFLDGRFFRVTLLTDPRFEEAALLIGGLTDEQLAANRKALTPLPAGAAHAMPPDVVEPPRLRALATLSTWGILVLEAAVALSMLAFRRWTLGGHGSLLIFCLVTYAFAPVAGFGWLLVVMGAAQARAEQKWLRRVYVAVFLVVLFYTEVPWAGLLLDLTS
jgi:hypothetical protein